MRNSSSLDWLRFMHTPNDYRVSPNLSTLRYIIRRVIPPNFYPRKIKERCLDIQVIIIEVTDRLTSFWQFFQLAISGNRN